MPLTDYDLTMKRQAWAGTYKHGDKVPLDRKEAIDIVDELLELRSAARTASS